MEDIEQHPSFSLKRVITVTLNPAVDLFVTVDTLEPGSLHRVDTPEQHVGGKGINVSKMLAALSVPTIATGFLGGHRGRWLQETLEHLRVDTRFTTIAAETRLNVKVVDKDGTLTELNSPAPAITEDEWASFEQTLTHDRMEGQWLALCGNLPAGCPDDWYKRAIQRAKAADLFTLLDASGEAFRQGIEACPEVIKPNREELSQFAGRELTSVAEVIAAAKELVHRGISLVVVSLGGDGLIAVTSSEQWLVRVPKVPVISTVGAGDTVVAGLLYGFYQGWNVRDSVRYAAAAGTAKVGKPGTRHPEQADIDDCLRQTTIEKWGSSQ